MLPDFKLYYKTIVIKRAWHWHKNKHITQCNRTEGPVTDPHMYGQLIYDKGVKTICQGNASLFNKRHWEDWTAMCKRKNWIPLLHHSQKLIQDGLKTWMWDLKPENFWKKTQAANSLISVLAMIVCVWNQNQRWTKGKINKWYHIKLKSFCTAKETTHKMKRQSTGKDKK